MKKKLFRKIIGGLSFTSALFVFQACYGTAQDFGLDVHIEGIVKSQKTGLPITNIKVSVAEEFQYDLTDSAGRFSFYTAQSDSLKVSFEDVDSITNGQYQALDSIITSGEEQVSLTINLIEK